METWTDRVVKYASFLGISWLLWCCWSTFLSLNSLDNGFQGIATLFFFPFSGLFLPLDYLSGLVSAPRVVIPATIFSLLFTVLILRAFKVTKIGWKPALFGNLIAGFSLMYSAEFISHMYMGREAGKIVKNSRDCLVRKSIVDNFTKDKHNHYSSHATLSLCSSQVS